MHCESSLKEKMTRNIFVWTQTVICRSFLQRICQLRGPNNSTESKIPTAPHHYARKKTKIASSQLPPVVLNSICEAKEGRSQGSKFILHAATSMSPCNCHPIMAGRPFNLKATGTMAFNSLSPSSSKTDQSTFYYHRSMHFHLKPQPFRGKFLMAQFRPFSRC